MDISPMELLILALASFRLTRLIVFDKITEFLRKPFLEEVEEKDENGEIEVYWVVKEGKVRGFFGELLSCYWCTGVWSTLFLYASYYFYASWSAPVLLILAIAGLAAIIESLVQKLIN
ncbi:DUF1360 domain-containing protein [Cytobacillus oceanisediminis]|uniref:DUF1360 domain-containing protein n=1 Tax=Cytobacillus oceanisediminis TaxID=665099 RepID=UPI001FB5387B|nr:DUF1360 domain-containing protein [Cytobacillus oceanisediminis]UOE56805.1 DUF1360 domain-containing protein [Cytobacillus oceanisediminis]